MTFRSIIQDMRDEIGSISTKGIEVKMGYGLRSGSRRVLRDGLRPSTMEALKQTCWANLPPELLREVLTRIEEAQALWPHRKDVVSCAGVCKSWREITKEIVKTPERSGKLTFPISVKQPGPRDIPLHCFIKRNQATQTFYLYCSLTEALTDNGKFLLAARKCRHATCTDYIISVDANDISKESVAYIGKLRCVEDDDSELSLLADGCKKFKETKYLPLHPNHQSRSSISLLLCINIRSRLQL